MVTKLKPPPPPLSTQLLERRNVCRGRRPVFTAQLRTCPQQRSSWGSKAAGSTGLEENSQRGKQPWPREGRRRGSPPAEKQAVQRPLERGLTERPPPTGTRPELHATRPGGDAFPRLGNLTLEGNGDAQHARSGAGTGTHRGKAERIPKLPGDLQSRGPSWQNSPLTPAQRPGQGAGPPRGC